MTQKAPRFVSMHDVLRVRSAQEDELLDSDFGASQAMSVAPELGSGILDAATLTERNTGVPGGNRMGNAVIQTAVQYSGDHLDHEAVNAAAKASQPE